MNKPVALVTGSSRGIGRAIAIELAKNFRIAVNYYDKIEVDANRAQAQEVLDLIRQAGGDGVILGADVSDPASAAQLIEATIANLDGIDVLVNNAGINKDQLMVRMTDAQWHDVIDTNLSSAFYCSRAALKYMMKKKQGRIINISSVVGWQVMRTSSLCRVKGGAVGIYLPVAKEYGPRGITANARLPDTSSAI